MAERELTVPDRIRDLNAINDEFAAVLQHAAQAIKALSPDAGEEGDTLERRKRIFEESTKAFYTGVQSGTAHLRRQAYALEEAGIIAAEAPKLASQQSGGAGAGRGVAAATANKAEPERITNGGLGNFDVGWLNSRGNRAGAEKEAELMEEARELAQQVLKAKETAAG